MRGAASLLTLYAYFLDLQSVSLYFTSSTDFLLLPLAQQAVNEINALFSVSN